MNIVKQVLLGGLIIVAAAGCKPPVSVHTKELILPNQYSITTDTIAAATIRWTDFINDTTLESLIDIALKNNLDGMAAVQRIEMARAGVRSSRGALLPAVSATAEAAQRKWGLYTMDGAGNASTYIRNDEIVPEHLPDYFVGFRAAWEVDVWGKLKAKRAGALARYLASIEGRNFINTNIIAEVAAGYYELIALDNELSIIRNSARLQESALEMVRIQKASGVANDLGVRQMEAQLLSTQSLERQVMQAIFETESRLNLLLGRVGVPVQRNPTLYDSTKTLKVAAGIPSDLLLNRPDIRQAEYELRAARADVSAARAAFLPSFNVNAAFGWQAYRTSLLFLSPESIAYGLVGNLMAPVLNRSEIRSRFEYAKATQLEALYNYHQRILTGYTEVSILLGQLEAIRDQISLKQREVESVDRSVEVSNDLFRTGRATYLEVIVAQDNALRTKRDLVTLKKLQHKTAIDLYRSLGGGAVNPAE